MSRKPKIYREDTNKNKIKFYSENDTEHKQVIVFGKDPKGKDFEVICDWGIMGLIKTLNVNGVRTLFSCMGNTCGATTAYVIISSNKLSKKKLKWVDDFIRAYWHDKYVQVEITYNGDIGFYAYTKHQLYETDKNILIRSKDDKF